MINLWLFSSSIISAFPRLTASALSIKHTPQDRTTLQTQIQRAEKWPSLKNKKMAISFFLKIRMVLFLIMIMLRRGCLR
jgi:hypothetical protein